MNVFQYVRVEGCQWGLLGYVKFKDVERIWMRNTALRLERVTRECPASSNICPKKEKLNGNGCKRLSSLALWDEKKPAIVVSSEASLTKISNSLEVLGSHQRSLRKVAQGSHVHTFFLDAAKPLNSLPDDVQEKCGSDSDPLSLCGKEDS